MSTPQLGREEGRGNKEAYLTLRAVRLRVESTVEGAAEVGCENDAEESISGFAKVDAAWLEDAVWYECLLGQY